MKFPYHVQVVRDYLLPRVGVRVATDVPATRPQRLITLESIPGGGGYGRVKDRVLSRRRLLVYAWGTSETDAYELSEQVRGLLIELPGKGLGVRSVHIEGEPSRRDDPDSGHRRFVLTATLVMRANP